MELDSPLPPAAVLAALATRGREWRESRMLPALRAAGYYAVRVRLRGARFRVWLAYSRAEPLALVLAGDVRPAAGGGSTVPPGSATPNDASQPPGTHGRSRPAFRFRRAATRNALRKPAAELVR